MRKNSQGSFIPGIIVCESGKEELLEKNVVGVMIAVAEGD